MNKITLHITEEKDLAKDFAFIVSDDFRIEFPKLLVPGCKILANYDEESSVSVAKKIHTLLESDIEDLLIEVKNQLEYLNESKERGTTNNIISRLDTIIQKLES